MRSSCSLTLSIFFWKFLEFFRNNSLHRCFCFSFFCFTFKKMFRLLSKHVSWKKNRKKKNFSYYLVIKLLFFHYERHSYIWSGNDTLSAALKSMTRKNVQSMKRNIKDLILVFDVWDTTYNFFFYFLFLDIW